MGHVKPDNRTDSCAVSRLGLYSKPVAQMANLSRRYPGAQTTCYLKFVHSTDPWLCFPMGTSFARWLPDG